MGVSIYRIKRWYKMFAGKSLYHVDQNEGENYSKDENEIKGYYNNLTQKVLMDQKLEDELPKVTVEVQNQGKEIFFSIAIFQYGLGAYDLYLKTGENKYYVKFIKAANWAVSNIGENGAWTTFDFVHSEAPFSAMAQGEGVSLLTRAYRETKQDKFLKTAHLAFNFLIKPIVDGGVAKYNAGKIYLYEYTNQPLVLNGFIFSIWGLWDLYLVTKNYEVRDIYERALKGLKDVLSQFDNKYWSKYNLKGALASPFYHKLHIAQLKAMYGITNDDYFKNIAEKWGKRERNIWFKSLAIIGKGIQKLNE